jgi:hypothetical protein
VFCELKEPEEASADILRPGVCGRTEGVSPQAGGLTEEHSEGAASGIWP